MITSRYPPPEGDGSNNNESLQSWRMIIPAGEMSLECLPVDTKTLAGFSRSLVDVPPRGRPVLWYRSLPPVPMWPQAPKPLGLHDPFIGGGYHSRSVPPAPILAPKSLTQVGPLFSGQHSLLPLPSTRPKPTPNSLRQEGCLSVGDVSHILPLCLERSFRDQIFLCPTLVQQSVTAGQI